MIRSMTAFARAESQGTWGEASWIFRARNHRYLDVSLEIPDIFYEWEISWRQQVSRWLARGKVVGTLVFRPNEAALPAWKINEELVNKLTSISERLTRFEGVRGGWSVRDLIEWPRVLEKQEAVSTSLEEPLSALLEAALVQLVEGKRKEGHALKAILSAQLDQIFVQISKITERVPFAFSAKKQKILQRIAALGGEVNEARLAEEWVFYAERADIQEEIDRLKIHGQEVATLLEEGSSKGVGKHLDFLMQELHREANTLSSKAVDHEVCQSALALKVLIEQMREQIQNVE